jgi:hypothetical protein
MKNNTLKRLGMKKEFKEWLKNVESKNRPFKVGDCVVLEPTRYFSYEKHHKIRRGHKGIIKRVGTDYTTDIIKVDFPGKAKGIYVFEEDIKLL